MRTDRPCINAGGCIAHGARSMGDTATAIQGGRVVRSATENGSRAPCEGHTRGLRLSTNGVHDERQSDYGQVCLRRGQYGRFCIPSARQNTRSRWTKPSD